MKVADRFYHSGLIRRCCSALLAGGLLCSLPNVSLISAQAVDASGQAGCGEYLYQQLNGEEQAVYRSIVEQVDKLTVDDKDPTGVKVTTPKDSSNYNLEKTLFAVFRDHPEFFWVNASQLVWQEATPNTDAEGNNVWELSCKASGESFFYDGFEVDNVQSYREKLDKKVQEILDGIPQNATDDVSKLKYINDWIAANNVYNASGVGASNFSRCAASGLLSDNDLSTTDDDPVCYGYATAFKVLLDAMDIPNAYIEGWAYNNNNVSTNGEQHAWNYVQLDDGTGQQQWYAIDPTWDDPSLTSAQEARQVYFLVGQDTVTERNFSYQGENYSTFGKNHNYDKSPAARLSFTYPTLSKEARNPSADGNVVCQKEDGSTKAYDTLAAAMADARSGDTLILKSNLELDSTLTIPDGVTIDLNGQTGGNSLSPVAIKSSAGPVFRIESGDSATIVNSGRFTAIKLDSSSSAQVVDNQGTLTLGANVQFSCTMQSMDSSSPIAGNPPELQPHTRYYVPNARSATVYLVAEPEQPKAGTFAAQDGNTVQELLQGFAPPQVEVKFYNNTQQLLPVPGTEYQCDWTLQTSPDGGDAIKPDDPLQNGNYTFTATVFDYPLTYEVEVTGLSNVEPPLIKPKKIGKVSITGLDEPKAKQALDTTVNSETQGAVVSSVAWEPAHTTAQYDTVYTAILTLIAEHNYAWEDTVAVTVGQKSAAVTINQDGTLTARVTFDATEQKPVDPTDPVDPPEQPVLLQSIEAPAPISVKNGTALTALPLPSQVNIKTNDGKTNKANVTWTRTPAEGTSYDPSLKTEQNFRLQGSVQLPEGVEANGVSMIVTIQVKVAAAESVTKVTAEPEATPEPGTYTRERTVKLWSDTSGAKIYYTMDGSEPSKDHGKRYTDPIRLRGEEGERVRITIKAIAICEGYEDSDVVTFKYTIKLPDDSNDDDDDDYDRPSHRPGNSTDSNNGQTHVVTDSSGTRTETIRKDDGSVQMTVRKPNGSSVTAITDKWGNMKLQAVVSAQAVQEVWGNPSIHAVSLPLPELSGNQSPQNPSTVSVQMPTGNSCQVSIPVKHVMPGTVAVLVYPNGTRQVVPTAVAKQGQMQLPLAGNVTVQIMDNSQYFWDVPPQSWKKTAADFVSSRGLLVGTGSQSFSPDTPMQQAMMSVVLARLDGQNTNGGANWYEQGVTWAQQHEIWDNTNPQKALTREELATMLYRYAQYKGKAKPVAGNMQDFADYGSISSGATEAMQWAVGSGILYGDGAHLYPRKAATRAEVSAMLMRLCENVLS